MSVFIPSKLSVTYLAPATPFRPLEGRKYTLTHSDTTGQLFLTIGCEYNYSAVNYSMRDEVLAEWIPQLGEYSLCARVYVSGGEYDENYTKVRFMIFQKELNLALQAMVNGDQALYSNFPWLLDAPIYVHFESIYPQFNQVIFYGTPRNYLI
ncbi:staygreen family protein [Neobacillus drentensis]|uniref:staygreen family protein n=1 Tax=Neobacillus drentensis TaxID=220684 RepID=UPI003000677D